MRGLQEVPVRVRGQIIEVGDVVVVHNRDHPGEGTFRGQLADGRVVVRWRVSRFGSTLLRLRKGEIEKRRPSS